jgi:hypothetical protein
MATKTTNLKVVEDNVVEFPEAQNLTVLAEDIRQQVDSLNELLRKAFESGVMVSIAAGAINEDGLSQAEVFKILHVKEL